MPFSGIKFSYLTAESLSKTVENILQKLEEAS